MNSMNFCEELRNCALKVCQDNRFKELYLANFVEQAVLDDLANLMRSKASEGEFGITVSLNDIVSPAWKEVSEKDYRSPDKRKFDEELCEYLNLYYGGVQVGINREFIHLSWR